MSTNLPPRPGYTRTGKSLKAVRRYYALLNQKKSPEEGTLSKRIAAELKTQQDANEKRSKRMVANDEPIPEPPTPPNPSSVSQKEGTGFVAPLMESTGSNTVNYKSTKSNKSVKSVPTGRDTEQTSCCTQNLMYFLLGLFLGIAVGASLYYGLSYLKNNQSSKNQTKPLKELGSEFMPPLVTYDQPVLVEVETTPGSNNMNGGVEERLIK